MARITKISMKNVKRTTAEVDLSGRDLWTGPNGCGKSTNLESFLIGMLGYIPGRGKELSDAFQLASGDEVVFGLESDNGFKCSRSIREKCTKKKTGERSYSLTMDVDVFPPRGEKTDKDRRDRVTKEFGDSSVLLDLGALFAMSDAERRKFIFSLTDPSQFGWDKSRFIGEVSGNNSFVRLGYDKQIGAIWDDSASLQENVARILVWAKEQLSTKKSELKKAQAAKEQLLAQKRELGSDPGSAAELENELSQARKDFSKLTADAASAASRLRAAAGINSRIARCQSTLDSSVPKTFDQPSIYAIEEKIKRTQDEIDNLKAKRDAIESDVGSLTKELNAHTDKMRKADARAGAIGGTIKKVDSSKGICPLLGEKCEADLSKFVNTAKAELAEALKYAREVAEARSGVEDKISKLRDQVRSITNSIDLENVNLIQAKRCSHEMTTANELAKKDADVKEAARKDLEAAHRELAALQLVDVAPIEAARDGMSGRIGDLERELNKRRAVSNLLDSFDRANIEAEKLAEEADSLDDLVRFVGPDRLQGQILKDTIGPLIDKVNALLSKTGRNYNLEIVMEGKNGQQILGFSWKRDGDNIDFNSLSGGEKVVFGAALCCALVLMKNPPCKAIVIEASECDSENLVSLMDAIGQFGGGIDNVLIATHVDPGTFEVPGWKIHRMRQKKALDQEKF